MKFIKTILYIGALVLMASCSTTTKVMVKAPAGTSITLPDYQKGIQNSKNNDIELNIQDDTYYGYALATTPSGLTMPFGLDVHEKNYPFEHLAKWGGVCVAAAGLFMDLVGTIIFIAANEDEDMQQVAAWDFLVPGLSGAVVGAGVGWPASERVGQLSHAYNFTYDKNQTLNLPQLSTTLLHPDAPKNAPAPVVEQPKKKKAVSAETVAPSEESAGKVKKSIADAAKKVAGTYSGKATLYNGKNIEEEYGQVELVIERIDKQTVTVQVIESDEEFFENPVTYTVVSDKKGGYILTNPSVATCKITISKDGKLEYTHPRVEIDDVMYTLKASASK